LEQLTEDHSLLQEQLNAGLITKAQAKTSKKGHLVTRALGTDSEVELELNSYQVKVDDLYLLCSDGLSDLVSDDEIRQQLLNTGNDVNQAVVNLVKLAIKHGGNDNISIVIALVNAEFKEKRSWIRKVLG